jgi:hypothetical protein
MVNPDVLSNTAVWPPEADELRAFTADGGRFLSGPGVIPVQETLPLPHDVGHEQGIQGDGLGSSDDQRPVMPTKPQPEELERAPKSSHSPIHTTTEPRHAICGGVIHAEQSKTPQPTEPPILVSLPGSGSEQPATDLTLAEARLKFKLEPNMTLSQDPDGKLVIQELDSPVTRREKAMRKKRARSQLAAPVVTASSTLEGSDLSSLSELSEDDDGKGHVKMKDEMGTKVAQPGEVVLEDGKTLEGGTLGGIIVYVLRIVIADYDL